MDNHSSPYVCGCGTELNRRSFLKTSAAGLAAAAIPFPFLSPVRTRAVSPASSPETLVVSLYKSLTDAQRKAIAFPFDHPLRSKVDNNWNITEQTIGKFLSPDQQQMVREIFVGIHSPEYVERVVKQVEHDNREDGGFGGCSVALFGEPGSGKFEFVFTGRHVTRRCDGDSVEGAAFGGPIFYGHAPHEFTEKPDHPDSTYWFQALRANEVFKALDGKQRRMALLDHSRKEQGTETVKLSGKRTGLPGIPLSELSRDQKGLVQNVLADLLAPFRKEDADEATKLIEANGIENLHMAFFKGQDVGNDGVWDVWQIEGPAMLWYFRGEPHVHTWVHIRQSA